jgi:hypothetical protein
MTTRDRGSFALLAAGVLLFPATAGAQQMSPWDGPGSWVRVSVEVDGRPAPLYAAPDGSGRRYLEARQGSSYAVHLQNRTGQRVGVALTVDGLNVISGVQGAPSRPTDGPGRMYILDPWGDTVVRGWRTSLSEIRRFTFVDESVSYAARTGQANPKMGWIELSVYRERRPYVRRWLPMEPRSRDEAARSSNDAEGSGKERAAAPQSAGEASELAKDAARAPRSYPGTGWGSRDDDPAQIVSFDPEPAAAEMLVVRYEYASALRALGILPRPDYGRDRLREREQGVWGFAAPPAW